MEKKDLVEGMRLYIYKLRMDGRYSTAKSYQDALNWVGGKSLYLCQ